MRENVEVISKLTLSLCAVLHKVMHRTQVTNIHTSAMTVIAPSGVKRDVLVLKISFYEF